MPTRRPRHKPDLAALKQIDLIAFNQLAEARFLELLCKLLGQHHILTPREAQQEAAYELNISPKTAQRYLFKHTARRARFALKDGLIICKLHAHDKMPF